MDQFVTFCKRVYMEIAVGVDTLLHVLEGDHLLYHWLNVDRTLTQSNRRSVFRTAASEFNQSPTRHEKALQN